jgi:ubiquinone/menaquinone biosynthesis C-methylase UbiE
MTNKNKLLTAYDNVLLNSDIYLTVRDVHVNALKNRQLILDSGCGTGNVTLELLKQNRVVYAADISKESLAMLKRKSLKYAQGLKIYNINIERKLPFENEKFDGLTSMFVIHLVKNVEKYFKEHYRILKSGGVFVLTGRMSKKNMERVFKSHENSLANRGLLTKYKKDLALINHRLVYEVDEIMEHTHSFEDIKKLLKKVGFQKIKRLKNPYFGQYYL